MSQENDASEEKSAFTLTNADIARLIQDPNTSKVDITQKISDYYQNGGFNEEQMTLVSDIFRTLVKDAEENVRKVLSIAIQNATDIPDDIILSLANDIEEISVPVLQFSEILTDEQLIQIVDNAESVQKQVAIARRENVSEHLSNALINTHNEEVVGTLLDNEGANVSEEGYHKIMEDFSEKVDIMGAVLQRDALPAKVIANLSTAVSDTILAQIQEKYADTFEKIAPIIEQTREIITAKAFGLKFTESEYFQFLNHVEMLKISEDMIPIYALSMGNLPIFEMYVARSAGVPIINIRTLLKDKSNKGVQAICDNIKMPDELRKIVYMLVNALRELEGVLDGSSIYLSKKSSEILIETLEKNAKGQVYNHESFDYVIRLIEYSKQYAEN